MLRIPRSCFLVGGSGCCCCSVGARFALTRRPGLQNRVTILAHPRPNVQETISNGGTLEHLQRIAGHASTKTTKRYDRTADAVSLDEIERIVI